MNPITQPDLTPIISAVEQAAALCQRVQDDYLEQNEKAEREPVTIADYGAQAILCRAIATHFPDDGIVAEEHGDQFLRYVPDDQRATIVQVVADTLGEAVSEADVVNWLDHGQNRETERIWVIDPIDGTKGFLARRRYAIAVGVLERYNVVAGVMGCPAYPGKDGVGKIFYAAEGQAFARPLAGGEAQEIAVSLFTGADDMRVVESVEPDHVDMHAVTGFNQAMGIPAGNILRSDGMGKYAMVASGDAEVYLRIPEDHNRRAKIWDHVAGVAILEAAGGRVTDIDDTPLDFSEIPIMRSTRFIIVTNGHIHETVLAALQKLNL